MKPVGKAAPRRIVTTTKFTPATTGLRTPKAVAGRRLSLETPKFSPSQPPRSEDVAKALGEDKEPATLREAVVSDPLQYEKSEVVALAEQLADRESEAEALKAHLLQAFHTATQVDATNNRLVDQQSRFYELVQQESQAVAEMQTEMQTVCAAMLMESEEVYVMREELNDAITANEAEASMAETLTRRTQELQAEQSRSTAELQAAHSRNAADQSRSAALLQEEHSKSAAELQAQHSQIIARLEAEHAQSVAELQARHAKTVADLQAEHSQTVTTTSATDSNTGDLVEKLQTELKSYEHSVRRGTETVSSLEGRLRDRSADMHALENNVLREKEAVAMLEGRLREQSADMKALENNVLREKEAMAKLEGRLSDKAADRSLETQAHDDYAVKCGKLAGALSCLEGKFVELHANFTRQEGRLDSVIKLEQAHHDRAGRAEAQAEHFRQRHTAAEALCSTGDEEHRRLESALAESIEAHKRAEMHAQDFRSQADRLRGVEERLDESEQRMSERETQLRMEAEAATHFGREASERRRVAQRQADQLRNEVCQEATEHKRSLQRESILRVEAARELALEISERFEAAQRMEEYKEEMQQISSESLRQAVGQRESSQTEGTRRRDSIQRELEDMNADFADMWEQRAAKWESRARDTQAECHREVEAERKCRSEIIKRFEQEQLAANEEKELLRSELAAAKNSSTPSTVVAAKWESRARDAQAECHREVEAERRCRSEIIKRFEQEQLAANEEKELLRSELAAAKNSSTPSTVVVTKTVSQPPAEIQKKTGPVSSATDEIARIFFGIDRDEILHQFKGGLDADAVREIHKALYYKKADLRDVLVRCEGSLDAEAVGELNKAFHYRASDLKDVMVRFRGHVDGGAVREMTKALKHSASDLKNVLLRFTGRLDARSAQELYKGSNYRGDEFMKRLMVDELWLGHLTPTHSNAWQLVCTRTDWRVQGHLIGSWCDELWLGHLTPTHSNAWQLVCTRTDWRVQGHLIGSWCDELW
eukprot:CAMPEP_0117492770 /NCGR_PEP_ID=MMETSP0784-20121206/18756_1 /TAXON_ID=39447 /ORGANISM="" /LENGTH=1003 /DNA_ID=CAMNT_0005287607 /DNA_START=1 /DNA_END=3010 /DNA_ORIENTATION=+